MEKLTTQELRALKALLARVEEKNFVFYILIESVLLKYDNNRTHAAQALGVSIRGLRELIRKYGLPPTKHGRRKQVEEPSEVELFPMGEPGANS